MSIKRVYGANEWREMTAAAIADGLNAAAKLTPMTLEQFFGAVAQAGGDTEKLGELWEVSGGRWVDRAEGALGIGNLAGIQGLLGTLPAGAKAAVGAETLGVIQAVLGAATLTAGAANWDPEDGAVPTFDAGWVTATLTADGWTWDGGQWARG